MQISASANRLQTVRVEVASLPESGPGAFTLSLNFTGARTAYNLPPTHSWLLDIFPPVRPLHGRTKQRRIRATQRNDGGGRSSIVEYQRLHHQRLCTWAENKKDKT